MSASRPPGTAPTRTVAPFGSWASPVTAGRVAGASLRLGQIALAGSTVFWTEGRPAEQGRNVLVRAGADGVPHDLVAAPWNVRSRVHEYGGGAFVLCDEEVVFSNFDDQRLYRLGLGGGPRAPAEPQPLTALPGMRYADAIFDAARCRLIAVREDHGHGAGEPVNTLVAIDLDSGAEQELVTGHDFFSSPCLSPDGMQLAWLAWDHPRMPWDGTELWLARLDSMGRPHSPRQVAGGATESVFQPAWSPAGELHFVSDRSGWWNLYRERGVGAGHGEGGGCGWRVEALCPMRAEFGVAQWAFGMSTYGFDGRGRIVCSWIEHGISHLGVMEAGGAPLRRIDTPFGAVRDLQVGADFVAFFGGSRDAPEALVRCALESGQTTVLRSGGDAPAEAADGDVPGASGDLSHAEAITFPSSDGERAHAFFYAPANRAYAAPAGERPPLIVINHGGPTGASTPTFRSAVQFWTGRGFAVVDVNYGGSTGYGRAYRERLQGRWGIVDVADAVHAARFLVARGDVDGARLLIRGASAGGYTTLAALTFHDVFAAGASHYGIGDLEALARDTHKFESRYLDSLVGPYPEAAALYRARSPVHSTHLLSSALIFFQGSEDRVVPPAQAEAMVAAVRARGLPVAYLLFEHEQHGFRRAENIARALEAELYFYARVLGFALADAVAPVSIDNLPPAPAPPSAA